MNSRLSHLKKYLTNSNSNIIEIFIFDSVLSKFYTSQLKHSEFTHLHKAFSIYYLIYFSVQNKSVLIRL